MPVRIAIADLPIPSMDEQLGAFALGGLPCGINCGGLGVVVGRVPLRALLPHCPISVSRYNVNILAHLEYLLLLPANLLRQLHSTRLGHYHKSQLTFTIQTC
jgi:hypothetical protein